MSTPTGNHQDQDQPAVAPHHEPSRSRTSRSISPTDRSQSGSRTRTTPSPTSFAAAGSRLRSASQKLLDANVPLGFMNASGVAAAKAPTVGDIRSGTFGPSGWNPDAERAMQETALADGQMRSQGRRGSGSPRPRLSSWLSRRDTESLNQEPFPILEQPEPPDESTISGTRPGVQDTPIGEVFELQERKARDEVAEWHPETEPLEVSPSNPLPNIPRRVTYGYVAPPAVPWTTSFMIGLEGFLRWFMTPVGFIVTIYGLNIVAWGGMLFLLLCNAAPAMCTPTCDDINSPRRIWIEIDSQILNALFCVTGFGLIPWRFRDLYWWCVWRLGIRGYQHDDRMVGIRRLAGIHRNWFRLDGSEAIPLNPNAAGLDKADQAAVDPADEQNEALPIPPSKRPAEPLTGVRAPPTSHWKMDFVVWTNVGNTFLQACLAGFMWGMNRYDRPSWSTGLFVALACIAAGAGGIMVFHEGKYVKKVEGVAPKPPPESKDVEQAARPSGYEKLRPDTGTTEERSPVTTAG